MSSSGGKSAFHVKYFIERENPINIQLLCSLFLSASAVLIIYLARIPAMIHVFIYFSDLNCVFFYLCLRKSKISMLEKRLNKV